MLVCAVCTEYSLFWHELCNVNASQWALTGGFFILLFHNNLDIFFYFLLLFLFSIFSVHDTDGFFSFFFILSLLLAGCLPRNNNWIYSVNKIYTNRYFKHFQNDVYARKCHHYDKNSFVQFVEFSMFRDNFDRKLFCSEH